LNTTILSIKCHSSFTAICHRAAWCSGQHSKFVFCRYPVRMSDSLAAILICFFIVLVSLS